MTKHHHQEILLKFFIFTLMCFVECITVKLLLLLLLPFAIVIFFLIFSVEMSPI